MTGDELAGGHKNVTGWAPGPHDVDLDRVWVGVAAQVWRRHPGPVERAAARLLRSPGLARALMTTPSLVLGWVLATTIVLIAGVGVTLGTGAPWVGLLAPALAAAGIAYAYGPGIDPAWELSQSMAVSDRMVLLVRAVAVFGLNAALGMAASAASGSAAAVTFGWLVPMTAVSALALATATVTRSPNVGVAAGLTAWVIAVLAGQAAEGQFSAAFTDSVFVVPYLALAACCGAVVLFVTRIPKGTV
jgi:hypothetical protein